MIVVVLGAVGYLLAGAFLASIWHDWRLEVDDDWTDLGVVAVGAILLFTWPFWSLLFALLFFHEDLKRRDTTRVP